LIDWRVFTGKFDDLLSNKSSPKRCKSRYLKFAK
jgi:hypothetical protein